MQDGGITAAVAGECFINSKKTQTAAEQPPKEDVSTLPPSPLNTEGVQSFDWPRADGQMVRPIARTLLFHKGLPFPKKSSLG